MAAVDAVVKSTDPLRVAESLGAAAGFGPDLDDIFERLYPQVGTHLARASVRPGIGVAWYEEPGQDGSVVGHAGFAIEDPCHQQRRRRTGRRSARHSGGLGRSSRLNGQCCSASESLVRWVEDNGYHLAGRSRELYLEWHDDDLDKNVTELQMPIAK
jgi:hypothetical protein